MTFGFLFGEEKQQKVCLSKPRDLPNVVHWYVQARTARIASQGEV